MNARRLVFLVPYLASVACGPDETPSDLIVRRTAMKVALGETAAIDLELRVDTVADGENGNYVLGCSSVRPSMELETATCGAGCTAKVEGNTVRVTAETEGEKDVRVAYRWRVGDDDEEKELHVPVTFVRPARLELSRDFPSPSGSASAMIVGDAQAWTFTVRGIYGDPLQIDPARVLLEAPTEQSFSRPSAIRSQNHTASLTWEEGYELTVSAPVAGTQDARFRYGDLSQTVTVRVADLEGARRVDLVVPDPVLDVPVNQAIGVTVLDPGALAAACWSSSRLIPRIELADGTIAYGGGLRLRASPPEALKIYAGNYAGWPLPSQLVTCGPGPAPAAARIVGTFGPIDLDAAVSSAE